MFQLGNLLYSIEARHHIARSHHIHIHIRRRTRTIEWKNGDDNDERQQRISNIHQTLEFALICGANFITSL